jgi:hypothetical protein
MLGGLRPKKLSSPSSFADTIRIEMLTDLGLTAEWGCLLLGTERAWRACGVRPARRSGADIGNWRYQIGFEADHRPSMIYPPRRCGRISSNSRDVASEVSCRGENSSRSLVLAVPPPCNQLCPGWCAPKVSTKRPVLAVLGGVTRKETGGVSNQARANCQPQGSASAST